jgi:excinuclease UvrABC ATPase subunit
MKHITITGAHIHNLKGINVSIPKNKLVVVTGVSGSGKSSLVFDILFEEGRKQYLQSSGILPGIDEEDKFDSISGIGPTIAVQQSTIRQSNPRSTVGSKTHLLSMLAVLYAGEGQMICSACGTPVDDYLTCGKCGNMEERLPANYFSCNAPNGMCVKCSGRGAYFEIHLDKLVPDDHTSLQQVLDALRISPGYAKLFHRTFKNYLSLPFSHIPDEVKADILYGHQVNSNYEKRSCCLTRIFQGHLYQYSEDLSGIYTRSVCSACHGFRVGEEARRVLLNGLHIGELGKLTLVELREFLETLAQQKTFTPFGKNLLKEILRKTDGLIRSRLGYLTLYREMPTLSGGEIQRLFLNAHLDSKMDSLIYILDEPTVGLHESEKAELLKSIFALKKLGNTVIVVEHDRNTIEMGEHIIDIGPKAGVEGGQLVYQGNLAGLLQCNESITGGYLSGKIAMPVRTKKIVDLSSSSPLSAGSGDEGMDAKIGGAPRIPPYPPFERGAKEGPRRGFLPPFRRGGRGGFFAQTEFSLGEPCDSTIPFLTLHHARTNNLKDVTVSFPLGVLVGIAGVSGSGKSSLIADTLIPLLKGYFHDLRENGEAESEEDEIDGEAEDAGVETSAEQLEGMEQIDGYAEVSQAPIGRNMNSNPVTYIGIWDKIRKLFARQPEATRQGLVAGHFSFNSQGACPACGGSGREKVWLGGDLNIYPTCRKCHGKRFNPEALSVRYQDKNICDVLEMSIAEAVAFFADQPGMLATLQVMDRIGMGYITLGQPTPTLSGGEAQRIKLAKEIGRRRKGNILYLLDEPTTGLSLYDTARLIQLLDELVAQGNSVVVIEHDPVVLEACDWIIELGPGGGVEGGRIVAEGTPQVLKDHPASLTGRYLQC